MVEIILRNEKGEWVIQTESHTQNRSSLKAFFDTVLTSQGTTLAGRLKSTSLLLKRRRQIPLWLNAKTYLMVIPNHQSPQRIYINGAHLKTIQATKEGSIITFSSGRTYTVQITYCQLKARFHRLQKDIQMIQEIHNEMDSKAPW